MGQIKSVKSKAKVAVSEPLIEIEGLTKEFNHNVVLKGINLTINKNEFVTLLGPSGCGKTTTLRILGGFERATSGRVMFEGVDFDTIPVHLRPTNTVFQRYALFPHLNVFDNVAFGLRIKRTNAMPRWYDRLFGRKHHGLTPLTEEQIKTKVLNMLKAVGLEGFENRSITKMSGGQQQRVAIARALVNEPKVLLLDEPLGALDLKLRQEMQYELKEIQRNTGITFIFVTHDQEEAMTMSDKIVIMKNGTIQQIGTPEVIYNDPVNRYVAKFVGESNIIEGTMIKDHLVQFDDAEFETDMAGFGENHPVDVLIRPEDIDIVAPDKGKITGVVDSIIFKGVHYEIDVKTDHRIFTVQTTDYAAEGKKVGITFTPEDIHIMEKMEHV